MKCNAFNAVLFLNYKNMYKKRTLHMKKYTQLKKEERKKQLLFDNGLEFVNHLLRWIMAKQPMPGG